jgi:hypothetical protein
MKYPSSGKSMSSEDKEKQPHTTKKTILRKLLPLWILIAINIPAIIVLVPMGREASDTSGSGPEAGPMAIGEGFGVLALILALIIFDIIYLAIWAFSSDKRKDNNDSPST